jgi:hypothetical protein
MVPPGPSRAQVEKRIAIRGWNRRKAFQNFPGRPAERGHSPDFLELRGNFRIQPHGSYGSLMQDGVYRQPWLDGKLTGPVQVALKLPFAFSIVFSGNGYDFTRDLSTIVYSRPGGQHDLYFLSQK